ncbi:sensory box histidine kinase [Treponema primitia ZAS-2]|uniref:histidine kinase n=1 Tax=Treponema primitia (strain ATCC BAA-887 / DSM 12427 / ZAS-2) TaxID=545694 RepID=F5YIH5_TREPZ|nr:ATP-binding protein [Treponema primitia]AEF85996.1 sensory box histidine kinase [Treponema primitia ZAS-2]
MREFIKRALQKLNKMTGEQTRDLLYSAAAEIDRLETVLDSITDGILVCDTENNLALANKIAERMLPMNLEEQGKLKFWQLVRDEKVRDFFELTLQNGDKVEEREFDLEIKGIPRLLSISVLPLVKDHQVTGSLIYMEDITEKRGKEAQLRRAENLASLTTLAAGVAHEIKNPLGSLSIHIQLIQKAMEANKEIYFNAHPSGFDSLGQDPRAYFNQLDKYIAVVNEEVDRLNRIVVDFLFAVRPMNMEFREGDINLLIRELADFVSYELEEARIKCILHLAPDLPWIGFDQRYIKQALLNLIKNAQAAMPNGGKLTIKTQVLEDEISIVVSDTGIGISEKNLSKIFEPYFTTKETGSGLGLTLVFKIIREHRGEISVKSKEGEGTSFKITLPIPQKERKLITFEGGI